MSAERTFGSALGGLFTDNLGLKAVSLLCALAIYAVHGADNLQRSFPVGVVSLMPPDGANRVLLNPLPSEVVATVRGSKTQLDDLRSDDIGTLYVDLHEAETTRLELKPSMIRVPAGLTVVSVTPSALNVRWDALVERSVPVQVLRSGEATQGFVVKATASDPPTITARGPRSEVDKMQSVRTTPFDVSGLLEGVHKETVALEPPPSMVLWTPDTVSALVTIVRELKQAQFTKMRVEIVGLPKGTVQPATVDVDIVGPAEDVEAIQTANVVPRVEPKAAADVDTTKPGSAMLPVIIDLPGVDVHVKPRDVLVKW